VLSLLTILAGCNYRNTKPIDPLILTSEQLECSIKCHDSLWECHCAFALKTTKSPACLADFEADLRTRCENTSLYECLQIVNQNAQVRSDTELKQAVQSAMICLQK